MSANAAGERTRLVPAVLLAAFLVSGLAGPDALAAESPERAAASECAPGNARACAQRLLGELRARAEERFIRTQGLHAGEDEVAAVLTYRDAFERHDRSQRAQKLAELEARIRTGSPDTPAGERARLLEFRALLQRLERHDADVDCGLAQREEWPLDTVRHWIEQAKLDRALFERYGGPVSVDFAGARAYGARAVLVAEHMQRESVAFQNADVAREVIALLWHEPPILHAGDPIDFTPFWRRPLRPSYIAP